MGKSLCFQVPAVVAEAGVTIVISPLLGIAQSLAWDLTFLTFLTRFSFDEEPSDVSPEERMQLLADLSSGHPKTRLLYITPEALFSGEVIKSLRVVYQTQEINRLVIDEAHCISEWGHDFRSDYRRLATPPVQEDIIRNLGMSRENLYKALHPFNRTNLFYEIRYSASPDRASQMNSISEYIRTLHARRGRPSSGIIYCRSKATCDELSAHLRGQGINAKPYHRGIPQQTLTKTMKDWEMGGDGGGGVDVVCATIAFGMGIDKSDVRWIIHFDLPKSFEGYYQETAREDALRVRQWVANGHANRVANVTDGPEPSQRSPGSLDALIKYAENAHTCRHVTICRYFGEPINDKDEAVAKEYCDKMCDVCKYPEKTRRRKQLNPDLLTAIQSPVVPLPTGRPFGNENGRQSNSWGKHNDDGSSLKRPISDTDGSKDPSKKLKVANLPRPLVTKSFSSASSLNKPFKTPLMSLRKPPAPAAPEPLPEPTVPCVRGPLPPPFPLDDFSAEAEDSNPELISFQINDMTERASSPIPTDVDESEVKLDASFSQKVESSLRTGTFVKLRGVLRKIFGKDGSVWNRFGKLPNHITTDDVIGTFARKLEFTVHSLASTDEGYKRGVALQLRALSQLKSSQVWDNPDLSTDADEVEEIIGILKQSFLECRSKEMPTS
ncbi:hypothetical protein ONZ45_g6223 [Pleurotus djamor]|nr:hypothetical protein ONZ45_g6223 [Pleurotus djamor]